MCNGELNFWRSVAILPSKMLRVLHAYTTSYLFYWYSVRYLFEFFFCKFHLQRANIVIQVLDLSRPYKSSREMNERYKRFDTLENKILQNSSKVIWNQTEPYMSILVNIDSWFYHSTKPRYHSFKHLAARQIYGQWCHKDAITNLNP